MTTTPVPADISRDDAIKTLRAALKAATGRTWSVRGGTGTAYGWITVTAPLSRKVDGTTTEDDARELFRILDQGRGRWENSRTVHIDPRDRATYVQRAQDAAERRRVALHVGGPTGDAARTELAAGRATEASARPCTAQHYARLLTPHESDVLSVAAEIARATHDPGLSDAMASRMLQWAGRLKIAHDALIASLRVPCQQVPGHH